jgi:hypothetical protein
LLGSEERAGAGRAGDEPPDDERVWSERAAGCVDASCRAPGRSIVVRGSLVPRIDPGIGSTIMTCTCPEALRPRLFFTRYEKRSSPWAFWRGV